MLNTVKRWLITVGVVTFVALFVGCSQDKSVTKGTDYNLKKVDFNPPVSSNTTGAKVGANVSPPKGNTNSAPPKSSTNTPPAKSSPPKTGIIPGK